MSIAFIKKAMLNPKNPMQMMARMKMMAGMKMIAFIITIVQKLHLAC